MTQEEAFSLFMRGLEPKIREQIATMSTEIWVERWRWRRKQMSGRAAVRDKRKRDKTNKKQEGQDSRDRDKTKKETKSRGAGRRVLGTQSREKGLQL